MHIRRIFGIPNGIHLELFRHARSDLQNIMDGKGAIKFPFPEEIIEQNWNSRGI